MGATCFQCFQDTLDENGICAVCGFDSAKNHEEFPLALPAGSILYGRYILGKVLGQGGYGITYLAQDYQTKELVAIKEFFPDTMATRTGATTVTPLSGSRGETFQYGRTIFLDEAKTIAELNGNPNVAGVRMYFEENGTGYYVMEYIEGTSFQEYIKAHGGRLSWADTARVMLPVLDTLEAVHAKGIIHRDVTPDNIYVTKDRTVKLLDFGAARHSLGNVSQSLDVILKHGFAPKEQYSRRGKQGPYTDVYAASASIYYALTGVKPDDAIDRSTEDTMPPPTVLGAKISQPLEDALMKGLAVEAADRYQTVAELRNALTGISTVKALNPIAPAESVEPNNSKLKSVPAEKKKNKVILTFAGASLLVIGFVVFWFTHTHRYGEWEQTKAATCEEVGLRQRKCFCGDTEIKVISALGHKIVTDVAIPSTCTEGGLSEGIHCSVCKNVLVEQQRLLPLGHEMVNLPAVPATCTDYGVTEGYVCGRCDFVQTEQIKTPLLGHSFSDNVCGRCGAKKWWVEFETTRKTYSIGERIEINFDLYTCDSVSSNSRAILKPTQPTIPSIVMHYKVYYKYANGNSEWTAARYFDDGVASKAGTSWKVWWKNGVSKKATVTLHIYDENNCELGSYTFRVE